MEIPALGCWYPVGTAGDVIVLCRAPGQDHAHGLCAEHAWRVLGARRRSHPLTRSSLTSY